MFGKCTSQTHVCVSALFFFSRKLLLKFDFSANFKPHVGSVHCLRTHKFYFSTTFSLKIGLTVLFTHLKIILLQFFLVFSFQQYSNGFLVLYRRVDLHIIRNFPRSRNWLAPFEFALHEKSPIAAASFMDVKSCDFEK